MTPVDAALGLLIGFVAGVLSGLFGVGGGIVMTPGIQVLMGAAPIVALATPLPAILPTALTGAFTYHRSGQVDTRATTWMVGPGVVGAVAGAALTDVVDTHVLLIITAALLGWQAIGVLRGTGDRARENDPAFAPPAPSKFLMIGLVAGFVSGLLGIGGGLIMVPLMVGWLGMPLKRALGTSLLTIAVLVIPGTVVHTLLGHIDWAIFLVVTLGAVPGARVGALFALGTREHTLRLMVGSFLLLVAVVYGATELSALL
jgi:uncharacterized membrane protein YfcA